MYDSVFFPVQVTLLQLNLATSLKKFLSDLAQSPPVLPNLEQLTIRIRENRGNGPGLYYPSWLPVVPEVVNSFISSLRHLSIDIRPSHINVSSPLQIDFSPLAVLAATSGSIPQIDLYVHTDVLPAPVTRAHVLSSLEVYEDIARLIKKGVLGIHSEKTAPDCAYGFNISFSR